MAANRKFVFKIKTKSGGIIGNIVIEAKDMEAAKYKLRQRYPDCEILEADRTVMGAAKKPTESS